MSGKNIRTTVALPAELLEAADDLVRQGKAKSRNELFARSLRRELAALERAVVDAAFARMADDAEFQAEARKIAGQFATSDWEAFQTGEALP
jgi:metal-responsive CopG/Arc/MetJ family transcriptional regulator|tara:strand:- start:187 stop:462 length:276 start_codon:yes stop_codon:yes gene_type:complete